MSTEQKRRTQDFRSKTGVATVDKTLTQDMRRIPFWIILFAREVQHAARAKPLMRVRSRRVRG